MKTVITMKTIITSLLVSTTLAMSPAANAQTGPSTSPGTAPVNTVPVTDMPIAGAPPIAWVPVNPSPVNPVLVNPFPFNPIAVNPIAVNPIPVNPFPVAPVNYTYSLARDGTKVQNAYDSSHCGQYDNITCTVSDQNDQTVATSHGTVLSDISNYCNPWMSLNTSPTSPAATAIAGAILSANMWCSGECFDATPLKGNCNKGSSL